MNRFNCFYCPYAKNNDLASCPIRECGNCLFCNRDLEVD